MGECCLVLQGNDVELESSWLRVELVIGVIIQYRSNLKLTL